jgi:hypothetical protein
MARVELEDTWTARGDVAGVRAMLLRFGKLHKMKIIDETDDELRLKQGSQFLTRLLGGWFVPASWLPKRATIVLQPADGRAAERAEARPGSAPPQPESSEEVSARRLRQPAEPAEVTSLPHPDGVVHIQALIEESLGFGFLDPLLKKKYQDYFEEWMDRVQDFTR